MLSMGCSRFFPHFEGKYMDCLLPYCGLGAAAPRRSPARFTTKATMSFRMNRMAFGTVRYCGLGRSLTGWLRNYLRGQEGGVLTPPQPASPPHPQPLSPREGGEGGRRPGEGVQFGGPEGPPSCGDGMTAWEWNGKLRRALTCRSLLTASTLESASANMGPDVR